MTLVRVTTAAEAAALDSRAILAGTPARLLMQRAGEAAAAEIARAYPVAGAVVNVFVGPGNNGGDGWVVARELVVRGARVFVAQAGEPRSAESIAERALAAPMVTQGESPDARLVVDALLGVGAKGAPRGELAACIARIEESRVRGADVVSLDVPSGVDADTGSSTGAVRADLTITFGTLKRGLAVARGNTGRILVCDIGLGATPADESLPQLVDAPWVRAHVPPIGADAHKGVRKKLAILGGQVGMAGAPMLAARAAMRSGIGMVRLVVARENLPVVQSAVPEALARAWPETADEVEEVITQWADGIVIGPGLGATYGSRALVERVLRGYQGPVVLDADALNVFSGESEQLGELIGERPALLTPHPAEFARMLGVRINDVLARRFGIGVELAQRTRAVVLLKGVPTVISDVTGRRLVSCAGTPVLAAAGSGDLLSGIAGTLMAQIGDARIAGACAAWAHGRAAELAGRGQVRGVTLADIDPALREVWNEPLPTMNLPVLADLPAIGDHQ